MVNLEHLVRLTKSYFGVLAGGERLACVHIMKLSERSAQNAEYKCFLFTRKIPDTKPDWMSAPDCPKSEDGDLP